MQTSSKVGMLVLLTGCNPTNPVPDPLIEWTLVTSISGYNLQPEYTDAVAGVLGDRVYFGPRANTLSNQFMLSFDAGDAAFGGPWTTPPGNVNGQNDFCGCGYTSVFVSGGSDLYLLGNFGMVYSPATDTWATLPEYDDYARGEAAATHDGGTGHILLLGGRETGTAVLAFDSSSVSFADEGSTLPGELQMGGATTPAGGTLTYAAGGDTCEDCLFVHDSGTSTWSTLAVPPDGLRRNRGMGSFEDSLWYASDSQFFLYDPTTNTWEPENQALPTGFTFAAELDGDTFAFAKNGNTIEAYRLEVYTP